MQSTTLTREFLAMSGHNHAKWQHGHIHIHITHTLCNTHEALQADLSKWIEAVPTSSQECDLWVRGDEENLSTQHFWKAWRA